MQGAYIVSSSNRFIYDPNVSGFDTTYFATISGTPATSGAAPSQVLRFNNAWAATFSSYWFPLNVEWTLKIQTAPTAGHVRFWGFCAPANDSGNLGKIGFSISGAVFSFVAYDKSGNALVNVPITWSAGYTNTSTRFRIEVTKDTLNVLINDVAVVQMPSLTIAKTELVDFAQPIMIRNGVADNMDLILQVVRQAGSVM